MALTFPLAFPSHFEVKSVKIRASSVVGVSVSPFTKEQQVYVHQGECWSADVVVPPLVTRALAARWVAFLVSLNGMEGTFLMGDPLGQWPRGVGTGTPTQVSGAGQTGKTLVTDGWTAGVTGILKQMDWIQLGSGVNAHLHMVVADANSNGSGVATFEIWPRLRGSPADNAAVTVINPMGAWRLSSNDREWSVDAAQVFGLSFSCQEAL